MQIYRYIIYLSYEKEIISKTFTWLMVGETIINNLLKKNNNTIIYPVKDINGDITFGGELFSEKKLVINKEEN